MTAYPAASPLGVLFVFAHGAGAGQHHPFMTGYARALADRGADVVTFDFPYMAAKRRLPDRAPVLEACFRDVIAQAHGARPSHRLFIGGKSMGGRIASHLASQPEPALDGVISLGYPLHPPGKPEQLRVAHIPSLRAPWLIVQGERDTFGTPSAVAQHLAQAPVDVTLQAIAGGDHSFVVKGRPADQVRVEVVDLMIDWMRQRSRSR